MMTLFPIAVVIYSLVWFNNWYVSDAGALQIVEWKQFGNNGVPLDGGSDMRQTVKDQTLTCLASSGCWFTVYEYNAEGRTCPSGAEIAKQQQNAALMGQKVTSPIDADVEQVPEKRKAAPGCRRASYDWRVFQTLDPIDTFTVFWKYDASAPSSAKEKFGPLTRRARARRCRNCGNAADAPSASARCGQIAELGRLEEEQVAAASGCALEAMEKTSLV